MEVDRCGGGGYLTLVVKVAQAFRNDMRLDADMFDEVQDYLRNS